MNFKYEIDLVKSFSFFFFPVKYSNSTLVCVISEVYQIFFLFRCDYKTQDKCGVYLLKAILRDPS